MELTLFRTFLAVYRSGSFSAAAPLLGLSQPTVTTQIRTLEARLGQQLFQRLARGVAPTSVADELATQLAPHLDALAAVVERGMSPGRSLAKPVHLAGPPEFLCACVLPALTRLTEDGLKLRVTFGLADELLAGLGAGRFDIVVSTIRPRARALTAAPLVDEEFVLVAAPAWRDRIGPAALDHDPVAALHGIPLIAYAEDLPIIRRYWRSVFGTRVTGTATIVVPDLRGVLASSVAGAGITVLPRYLCAPALDRGELVPLHEPEIPPINTIFLATRTGTTTMPHIATVHNALTSPPPRI